MIKKDEIKGSFDKLDDEQKKIVMQIVLNFHYMDGTPNNSGPMGRIEITPGELNDCLAYIFNTFWLEN